MKRKTIGLVLVASPYTGGVFQYENLLAEALCNNKDKYNIIVICNDSYWIDWCIKNNIKFIEDKIEAYGKNIIETIRKYPYISSIYHYLFSNVGKLIKKEKIKLIIFGQQGLFFPNLFIKQLCPVHDLMHRYENGFPERETIWEEQLLQQEVKFVQGVLVDSHLGKLQVTESYFSERKKRPLIQVLPYTVSKHIACLEEEYISTPHKYIFYPAQFWQHKNHLNLLKAINLLKEIIPDIRLVLVGSEKNSQGIVKKYIKEKKLESFVTIYGFVTNKQITYLYKHATLMIMPSYYGPTNIPPLEAMTLGCPVAVSNNYAMGEQVEDAGLLFNPNSPAEMADCIYKVWNDDALRKSMIEKGYKQINKWQPEDFEHLLIKTIDEILDN